MSIEDLMNTEVTSVSKKEQKLSRTASAVFVISQEDIKRSGAMNIPDLLRMVPGVDVAQINANKWAISARGLNGESSNEVLVTVDGRNVYVPTFGGVFWDVLDFPLENIDRIEVIRGPGGSVWGANAVNGVINIITKKAGQTRGATVVAGGGNLNQGFGTVEYGGSLAKLGDYRVYSKYINQNHFPDLTGQNGGDGWHLLRGGFRTDSTLSPEDTLMLRGDMYTGKEGNPTTLLPSVTSSGPVNVETQVDLSGGFLQSVWNHAYSSRGGTTLMVSYDAYTCDDFLREGRKTFNADFQSNFARGSRHEFVWGLGYRYSASHSDGNLSESLNPASLNTQLFSGFAQDEVALVPDRVYLTVGTKLEHNYYSGFGVMPSVRVTYAPNDHHMLWAAVSRALRTPAAADTSIRVNFAGFSQPDGTHVLIGLRGNPRFKNEGLTAYEMGYRTTVGEHLSVDFAAYYHAYDYQQTIEPATPFFETTPLPAHLVLPSTRQNLLKGEAHGLEIAANWKATRHWTISTGYDFERIHMRRRALSQDLEEAANVEGTDPHVHAQIRSHVDLSERLSWDASTYFVDRLNFHGVPAYTRLDTGVSWQWSKGLSLSLVGQNLVQDHHLEFVDDSGARQSKLIKRGAYAKITWKVLRARRKALNRTETMRGVRHQQGAGSNRRDVCRRCRQCAFAALAGLAWLAGAGTLSGQDSGSSEYQVKAAFLFHFAQFVEWPPETFKGANTPLTYCTIGDDPFHGGLDQSLSGKTVGTRPLQVRHLKETREIPGCQILFLGAGEKKRLGEAMASVGGHPVLTVGETEHFAKEGGMIGFCLEENKVRFEVNLEAAEKANLKISSKLLALAKTVIGNPRGN